MGEVGSVPSIDPWHHRTLCWRLAMKFGLLNSCCFGLFENGRTVAISSCVTCHLSFLSCCGHSTQHAGSRTRLSSLVLSQFPGTHCMWWALWDR